ncbi:hypothetical protein AAFF_G00150160 [Aldrovandia affinis]|uniref:Uncharacterized protein n=1 Tax=Aldrovandia affinis TaxID=143900 RepID=A0AAD7R0U0_9TELE|nr:hypothetical protein AAFF_G00150160 [Aldrovandia affinis]
MGMFEVGHHVGLGLEPTNELLVRELRSDDLHRDIATDRVAVSPVDHAERPGPTLRRVGISEEVPPRGSAVQGRIAGDQLAFETEGLRRVSPICRRISARKSCARSVGPDPIGTAPKISAPGAAPRHFFRVNS